MGVSPKRKRKRRGPRPVDRQHLERHCERCGASLANNLNAPGGILAGLCSWCEWQWHKMENE
jgi:transcription elongation factor Elf1